MKEIIHAIECVRQIKQTTNELTPDILKILRQQEKVNELLGLYRSAIKGCPSHVPLGILKNIDKLESELYDNK